MRIAVTSQNLRTVTPHAGKTRRFVVYEPKEGGGATEVGRLELPQEMVVHHWNGAGPHPLDEMDVVIVASCGEGFARRMAARGIGVVWTEETDPLAAAERFLARLGSADGEAPAVAACNHDDAPHEHAHEHAHGHEHGHEHGHCHGGHGPAHAPGPLDRHGAGGHHGCCSSGGDVG